jgi:hypothetical protein
MKMNENGSKKEVGIEIILSLLSESLTYISLSSPGDHIGDIVLMPRSIQYRVSMDGCFEGRSTHLQKKMERKSRIFREQ